MARTLEGMVIGAVGTGDEGVGIFLGGILLLCQIIMALSIISMIVFVCADCTDEEKDAGKEKVAEGNNATDTAAGENNKDKKDDRKDKRSETEVSIGCCGEGCFDGGSGCGGGCGGD